MILILVRLVGEQRNIFRLGGGELALFDEQAGEAAAVLKITRLDHFGRAIADNGAIGVAGVLEAETEGELGRAVVRRHGDIVFKQCDGVPPELQLPRRQDGEHGQQ